MKNTDVGDIMTKEVISVEPGGSLQETASLLARRRIHGVPVLDGGRVVGIVTETDFFTKGSPDIYLPSFIDFVREIRRIGEVGSGRGALMDRLAMARVRDIMSSPCETVSPALSIKDLIQKFRDTGFSLFPVVDEKGSLRGIVALADVLMSIDI